LAKQLSGAQKRKLKREREDAERREVLGIDGESKEHEAFAELGPPDLNNPDTALDFTRKYLLISLHQIGVDPSLPARDRWRMIKDTAQAIGMTHPRASIESKFKKLKSKREEKAKQKAPNVARPPTARSYRDGGGGDSLSRPVPGATPTDDGRDPVVGG
jgi:hypothetical protein